MISSFTAVLLNLWSPTDYPRQPGDGWRSLGKAYIAVAVTWLVLRWAARRAGRKPNLRVAGRAGAKIEKKES